MMLQHYAHFSALFCLECRKNRSLWEVLGSGIGAIWSYAAMFLEQVISELPGVTCHMGSQSVTFHPTQVNTPTLIQAKQTCTRYTDPRVRWLQRYRVTDIRLLVTSLKVHWSEGSLVRNVTGPTSNPHPHPNPNRNPNPKLVFDLRNKETLKSFSLYKP